MATVLPFSKAYCQACGHERKVPAAMHGLDARCPHCSHTAKVLVGEPHERRGHDRHAVGGSTVRLGPFLGELPLVDIGAGGLSFDARTSGFQFKPGDLLRVEIVHRGMILAGDIDVEVVRVNGPRIACSVRRNDPGAAALVNACVYTMLFREHAAQLRHSA
jgi:DNA-directed RNA polymerase subunit RPC12/RpoP